MQGLHFLSVLLFGLALVSCSAENSLDLHGFNRQVSVTPQVIYGNDDRLDWYEVSDERILSLADSTAGLLDKASVQIGKDTAEITPIGHQLCPEEAFSDQESATWCSGFLVAPDLMVTAGHCIAYQNDCTNIAVVFGFAEEEKNQNLNKISPDDVYTCKSVIARRETQSSADWALIKLDRPVEGRNPLAIRRAGTVKLNTPLFYIGHPMGLPSKISGKGEVLEIQKRYFKSNLDSFVGSSGSAVFNKQTLEVEGIISRGKEDFIYDKKRDCLVSNVCENKLDGDCTAPIHNDIDSEHITKITEIIPHIPAQPKPPKEDGDKEDEQITPYSSKGPYKIRDNSLKTTTSTIEKIPAIENFKTFRVKVNIKHSYISDLTVKLVAPNKNEIFLHNRTGEKSKNIFGVYGSDLKPYESLQNLGVQKKGDWRLEIKDHSPYDEGSLISWALIL